MSSILIGIVLILIVFWAITVIKFCDCGVLGIMIWKFIGSNIELFVRHRKYEFKRAFNILIESIKYKIYLEKIEYVALIVEYRIEVLSEMAPNLTQKERVKLNNEMKKQNIRLRISKNNKVILERRDKDEELNLAMC